MASAIEQQLLKIRQEAEEREAKRKAGENQLPYLDLARVPLQADALKIAVENESRSAQAAPIALKHNQLSLAVLDPNREETKSLIKNLKGKGYEITLFQTSLSSLEEIWKGYEKLPLPAKKITGVVEIEERRLADLTGRLKAIKDVREAIAGFNFQESSVTEILEIILAGAVANRASDIHFEPKAAKIRIRFRVDGLLSDVAENFPDNAGRELVSRVKILSRLKIDVTKSPQDGRFSVGLSGREIEVRVSVVPSEFGETMVMRILDPAIVKIPLQDLGLRADDLEIVLKEIQKPHGMILNTGPTGSGKTTTLYSFLRKRSSPEVKIITIEDPIEYHLEGIEQTQVNPDNSYVFANGLAAVMRQDPDIILVGEIRDKETAAAAIQAALTGHLVFSTVHANQAVGAIARLVDLGVKQESIKPAVNLIMAQRLVRRLCRNCRIKIKIDTDLEAKIKRFLSGLPGRVSRNGYQNPIIYKAGGGCASCNNSGYYGRVGIFELLIVGENEEAPEVTVQQDGILKVLTGITDFAEVERVAGSLEF